MIGVKVFSFLSWFSPIILKVKHRALKSAKMASLLLLQRRYQILISIHCSDSLF